MTKAKHFPHVYNFLHANHVGILSTVNADGQPWGSAVYFVVDDDLKVYFVTRIDTYKYRNLEGQPAVALTVVDDSHQETVQLAGVVSRVPAHDYTDIVFNKLASIRPKHDFNWAPPIEKIHAGDYMPLCITPTKLHYANYKKNITDYDQEFIEKII